MSDRCHVVSTLTRRHKRIAKAIDRQMPLILVSAGEPSVRLGALAFDPLDMTTRQVSCEIAQNR